MTEHTEKGTTGPVIRTGRTHSLKVWPDFYELKSDPMPRRTIDQWSFKPKGGEPS